MLNTNDKVIKHEVGLLSLAEELGNVSNACPIMGLSRDTFYRYKVAVDEGGAVWPDHGGHWVSLAGFDRFESARGPGHAVGRPDKPVVVGVAAITPNDSGGQTLPV